MNIKLSKLFLEVSLKYDENNDKYRAKAYARAAKVLGECDREIKSGKEAMKLHGIGKSIGEKIDEYFNTGTLAILSEIKKVENTEKNEIVELFKTIDGVGDITAKKWYEMGCRKFEDVSKMELTERQRLGIVYYEDLHSRIPREEIDRFKSKMKEICQKFEICGSYRRGKADSGDIDVLICGKDLEEIVNKLIDEGIVRETLTFGEKKFTGLMRLRGYRRMRHLDLMVISETAWPFALLHFTGSAEHNIKMRQKAIELSLTLNEYGLYDKEGRSVEVKSEREIFERLGMDYVEPENR